LLVSNYDPTMPACSLSVLGLLSLSDMLQCHPFSSLVV
jgi:hypothetical protein